MLIILINLYIGHYVLEACFVIFHVITEKNMNIKYVNAPGLQ